MTITDDMLVWSRENPNIGGEQRFYDLGNGYGLSLINSRMAHIGPFAWEAAVVRLSDGGKMGGLAYDTPLTNDVEVFATDDETNAFIAKAKEWAAANPKAEAAS